MSSMLTGATLSNSIGEALKPVALVVRCGRVPNPAARTVTRTFPCISGSIDAPKMICASESTARAIISEGDRPKRRSKESQARMRELMGEAKIGALLQFPTMRLRASELATLAPGMILRLPLAKHSASELRVGGLLFGRAHPVRTGEHRGAQLEGGECLDESGAANETMSVN